MWEPYINAVDQLLPEADIVHDKFHIAKYLGEAVDKVRKSEHKGLKKEGAETLKGTKYLWLTNPRNWSDEQKQQFKELKKQGLKVGRACVLLWKSRPVPTEIPVEPFFLICVIVN
jgi:transposase